jgi:AraC family transcriptional regulator
MANSLNVKSFVGTHGQGWEDPGLRSHSNMEVTIVLEGVGLFRTESGYEQRVEAGHVILIPCGIAHSFHALKPIRFGVLLMDGIPQRTQQLFDRLIPRLLPEIITLSVLDKEQYELLFRQWLRVLSDSLKDKERNYLAWIEVLLLFLYEHSQSDKQAFSITGAADDIRLHLHNPIRISDLASQAGYTEEGFRAVFFKMYGKTPKQYQQHCRLAEAKWLLSSSSKNMKSIAERIGFTTPHSFSAWFKNLEDVSPSEWKKQQDMNIH